MDSQEKYSDTNVNIPRTTRERIYHIEQESNGVKAEKLFRLKRVRSAVKGGLTKIRSEIESLMSDPKNIDEVSSKCLHLDNAMRKFREAHNKYQIELEDEYDVEESNEYYISEDLKVNQLIDRIEKWAKREKRKLESSIAGHITDNAIKPEDSISNAGSRKSRLTKTSKLLKNSSHVSSNYSRSSSASKLRLQASAKRASLIAESTTLQRRQAVQMKECLLESEIKKDQLELQQEKEKLRLETELNKLQAEENVYSNAELNLGREKIPLIPNEIPPLSGKSKDIGSINVTAKSLSNPSETKFVEGKEGNLEENCPKVEFEDQQIMNDENNEIFSSHKEESHSTADNLDIQELSPREPPEPDNRRDADITEFNYLSQKIKATSTPNENWNNVEMGAFTPSLREQNAKIVPQASERKQEFPENPGRNMDDGSTLKYPGESTTSQLTSLQISQQKQKSLSTSRNTTSLKRSHVSRMKRKTTEKINQEEQRRERSASKDRVKSVSLIQSRYRDY